MSGRTDGINGSRKRTRGREGEARILAALLAVFLLLPLAGCDLRAGYAEYEVIYPSGVSRDYCWWEEEIPVEGTSLYLQRQEVVKEGKIRISDLRLLDEDGEVVGVYPGMRFDTMRGAAAEDGRVWICVESWDTSRYNGYLDGWLVKGSLLLVDGSDGSVLFEKKTGKNEFYLTSVGSCCYFYASGEAERETWFGLVKIPERKARVYYRDLSDWEQENTIYTMAYGRWPQVEGEKVDRVRFYPEKDSLRIVLADYEQVDKPTNHWDYVEKAHYEIPLYSVMPGRGHITISDGILKESSLRSS